MENNNFKKKISWKNWLIKKLLSSEATREEVLNYIATNEEDSNVDELEDNNEKNLIKNILNLNDKSVEDVMVPRAEIISIEKNQTIKEVLSIIENETHSRMPVYDNNLDNVLGFLHIKDLLKNTSDKNFELQSVIRDVLYVAPKSPILDLLKRMRSSRIHMGLVVDEFGGVDGLVTIEDLVEEIVGEIEDEHDRTVEPKLTARADGLFDADARVPVPDLESKFGIDLLPDARNEEIDTLGGLVCELAGRVPMRGELIAHPSGMTFEVVDADPRRIRRLRVHPKLDQGDMPAYAISKKA